MMSPIYGWKLLRASRSSMTHTSSLHLMNGSLNHGGQDTDTAEYRDTDHAERTGHHASTATEACHHCSTDRQKAQQCAICCLGCGHYHVSHSSLAARGPRHHDLEPTDRSSARTFSRRAGTNYCSLWFRSTTDPAVLGLFDRAVARRSRYLLCVISASHDSHWRPNLANGHTDRHRAGTCLGDRDLFPRAYCTTDSLDLKALFMA